LGSKVGKDNGKIIHAFYLNILPSPTSDVIKCKHSDLTSSSTFSSTSPSESPFCVSYLLCSLTYHIKKNFKNANFKLLTKQEEINLIYI